MYKFSHIDVFYFVGKQYTDSGTTELVAQGSDEEEASAAGLGGNREGNAASNWFGSNLELTRRVMEYIQDPKDLYKVALLTKSTQRAITVEIVVRCAMFHGGKAYRTIEIMYSLMAKRAIYPPSPLRLLRLIFGKRCEFCNNDPVLRQNESSYFFPRYCKEAKGNRLKRLSGKKNERRKRFNPCPRIVRRNFGLFSCYPCMMEMRQQCVSSNRPYPCITRRWEKKSYKSTGWHWKQFWLAHRVLMFTIFNNTRVLAYPYGLRHHGENVTGESVWVNGNLISINPVRDGSDVDTICITLDSYEIMQSSYLRDASGEFIGSLLNHMNLRELTRHLISSGLDEHNTNAISREISNFLCNRIENAPSLSSYNEFLHTFQRCIFPSINKMSKVYKLEAGKKYLAHLNRIERTVHAISILVECTTLDLFRRAYDQIIAKAGWYAPYDRYRTRLLRPSKRDVSAFRRLLLRYKEEHCTKLKYAVTYNTGHRYLNGRMQKWLEPLLRDPRVVLSNRELGCSILQSMIIAFMQMFGLPRLCNIRYLYSMNGATDSYNRDVAFVRNGGYQWRDTSCERDV